MAAPMTSSEDLPAGISCAVTVSLGLAAFQAATTCLPQAISWALLEYQMVIGPLAVAASLLVPPPEPQAVSTRAPARTAAAVYLDGRERRGRFIAGPFLFGAELFWSGSGAMPRRGSVER